jgi:hypothetical protein
MGIFQLESQTIDENHHSKDLSLILAECDLEDIESMSKTK